MDILVVLLLITAVGVGVAGLLEARRSRTPVGERSTSTDVDVATSSSAATNGPDVRSEWSSDGDLVLSVPDGVLATLSFAPQADVPAADVDRSPALIAAVNELARAVPDVLRAHGDQSLRFTFSKETMQGLKDGSIRLMSGFRTEAVEVATGHVVEHGKVVGGAAAQGASWPVLLASAVASAAAAQQQQQLTATLNAIESRLDRLYQRQIDDDTGTLLAAADLAQTIIAASQNGPIPEQLKTELAIARRDVDAVYFARREQVRRFIKALESAQDDHERDTGESKAWAKGVEGAFADPQQFAGEATAFVRGAAIRAHLAAATAAVVANEGRSDVAFDLMDAADVALRSDVLDLGRRLRPLAATPPDGRSKKNVRQEAHAVCLELTTELERRITPLLPSGDADTVTFVIERSQLEAEGLPRPQD